MEKLIEQLKQTRLTKSTTYLAKKIGISPSHLSGIINHPETSISEKTKNKIKLFLGSTPPPRQGKEISTKDLVAQLKQIKTTKTIVWMAKKMGVSHANLSNVINHPETSISEKTKNKIKLFLESTPLPKSQDKEISGNLIAQLKQIRTTKKASWIAKKIGISPSNLSQVLSRPETSMSEKTKNKIKLFLATFNHKTKCEKHPSIPQVNLLPEILQELKKNNSLLQELKTLWS